MKSSNWKDVVVFTTSERRGVIFLIVLAVLTASFSYFVPEIVSNNQIAKFESEYACILQEARLNTLEIQNKTRNIQSSESVKEKRGESVKVIAEDKKTIQKPTEKLEINSVSVKTLISIGVQKEVAFRMIKFREKLGGFYSIDQLKEVYGMSDVDFQKLKEKSTLSVSKNKKIVINNSSYEELTVHPYISPKLANQIINFRTKFKPFESSDDVKKLYLVDEDLYNKIAPYISYN